MSLPTLTLLRALEWFKKSRLSSENLYHADLGSQNDGNSSRRELLWEMNNNNTSPDILCGVRWLFLVKANVSTSMKQQNYLVYCHLDQLSDEVAFSKCNCKPGQGGCWKHVTALLYRLLDYKNLEPKEVPDDVSCTQVLEQWSIPSNCSTTKVVKFEELTFEKADYARDKQKKVSTGSVKMRKLLFYSTICKEGTRFLCIYWNCQRCFVVFIYCIFFYDGVSLVWLNNFSILHV